MPEDVNANQDAAQAGFRSHPRRFQGSCWAYPVLSRRSGGISVGINISPERKCNFNCIYCQVDRQAAAAPVEFDIEAFKGELRATLELIVSKGIYQFSPFAEAAPAFRRLNDIAISGDGEPTASVHFEATCRACVEVKDALGLNDVAIIVITNASLLDRAPVQRGLELLAAHQGEIWAKLDAGSEAYFRQINQSTLSVERILTNIRTEATKRPVVIQTLLMRIDGEPVSDDEVRCYCRRLKDLQSQGAQLKAIQLHTVARQPRESRVSALTNGELDRIADRVTEVVDAPVQRYYGFATS